MDENRRVRDLMKPRSLYYGSSLRMRDKKMKPDLDTSNKAVILREELNEGLFFAKAAMGSAIEAIKR